MHIRKRLVLALVLVLSLGLMAACGSKSEPLPKSGDSKPAYDPNGSVTMVTNADPTFNPWHPNAFVESNVINEILFPGLTKWDENMQPKPELATEWKVSDDSLTWTFKLREGVKWHDGQPFTADDVAFTFNDLVKNKAMGANHSSDYAKVDKVVVKDPLTVEFKLNKPFADLPAYLSYYAGIIPKHVFQGVAKPFELNSFNKEKPIGTGPFKLDKFVPGSYLTLVANPDYYGAKPKLKSLTFKIVPDVNAQVAQLLSGDVDMIDVEDPAVVEKLKSNPSLNVVAETLNQYYWIALNQENPLFTDKRVRQALLMAIDRNAMINNLTKGYGQIATGPIPPLQKTFYDNTVSKWDYNPEKAKDLLKEAGWTLGPDGILQKGGNKLSFKMETGQIRQLVPATLLVQQFWKAVGVDAQPDVTDWNSYIKKVVVGRQYSATLAWWSTPAVPDVEPYYSSATAKSGYNIPGYKNEQLDQLLQKGAAGKTVEERVKTYKEVQKLMADELPYLYLWYPQGIVATNKRVQGQLNASYAVRASYTNEWNVPAK